MGVAYDIYIDFDGVVLDTITLLEMLFVQYGVNVKNQEELISFVSRVDWVELIRRSEEIKGSLSFLRELRDHCRLQGAILTHVTSVGEAMAKRAYLKEMVPGLPVLTVDKRCAKSGIGLVPGVVLVDDYRPNLEDWVVHGGVGVKFTAKVKAGYPFPQVTSLDEVLTKELVLRR